jgi:hypothetical protein
MTRVGVVTWSTTAIGLCRAIASASVPTYSSPKKDPISLVPWKLVGSRNPRSTIAPAKRWSCAIIHAVR